ncbi:uncharacterized protein LOC110810845 [Carica papaya]|uniref:uncharacterized protein LOC110810845 n=1 Tax=Carica papaya TaxID=3649 RepID=UPI000B8CE664|nr:uncharacterized protein LOC110810845 [Carica papaya]
MLLRESIEKSKSLFHKTLQNLKSIFSGRYQKLSRNPLLSSFSCSCSSSRNQPTHEFYDHFSADLEKYNKRKKNSKVVSKEPVSEEDSSRESFMQFTEQSTVKKKSEERRKDEKKSRASRSLKREEKCNGNINEGRTLAQRMKDLDMMDAGDMEHVLDVEEALHYYSRLKSPVYLDIVDKFFMDMYSEYSLPQASASTNNSKWRLRSIRL